MITSLDRSRGNRAGLELVSLKRKETSVKQTSLPANPEVPGRSFDLRPTPPPMGFYLPGQAGDLFAMYYRPNPIVTERGDVLYIHPFAGEMASSRNVIAAISRELASAGFGVLSIDLFGCGDSNGDFREARWEIWRDDLATAVRWLQEQGRERISLWGLRLGALQALDFAANSGENYEWIFLWQPVLSGETTLTQFFRMNLDEMGSRSNGMQPTQLEYRKSLPVGQTIEVAGYELSAELIHAIDKQNLSALGNLISSPVLWMEMGQDSSLSFRPESLRIIEGWRSRGVHVQSHKLSGPPFWLFPHSVSPQRIAKDVALLFSTASI